MPDVGDFDRLTDFPTRVLFWNPGAETSARHRNPLFGGEVGITLDTFGVDVLHTLNLGIYQKFLGRAWWALVTNDAFGVLPMMGGRKNQEELATYTMDKLKVELKKFYEAFEAANPGVKVNRVQDLSLKTLGSRDSCALHTKAAETRPLLRFTADLLAQRRGCLPASDEALVPAAEALARFAEGLRVLPRQAPAQMRVQLMNQLVRYVALAKEAGVPETPKLHLAMHLVHRSHAEKQKNQKKRFGRTKKQESAQQPFHQPEIFSPGLV